MNAQFADLYTCKTFGGAAAALARSDVFPGASNKMLEGKPCASVLQHASCQRIRLSGRQMLPGASQLVVAAQGPAGEGSHR